MAASVQHSCITAKIIQDSCIMATSLTIKILRVASNNEITCIGLEVAKAAINTVNKKARVVSNQEVTKWILL